MQSTSRRSDRRLQATALLLVACYWIIELNASWRLLALPAFVGGPIGAAFGALALAAGPSRSGLAGVELSGIAAALVICSCAGVRGPDSAWRATAAGWAVWLCVPDTEHMLSLALAITATTVLAAVLRCPLASQPLVGAVAVAGAIGSVGRPAAMAAVIGVVVLATFEPEDRSGRLIAVGVSLLLSRTVGLWTSLPAALCATLAVVGVTVGIDRVRRHRRSRRNVEIDA